MDIKCTMSTMKKIPQRVNGKRKSKLLAELIKGCKLFFVFGTEVGAHIID